VKILLVGKNGQIGWELQQKLPALGEIAALGSAELDLADFEAVRRTVREIKPAVIVNAAAYTAVDKAEEEPDKAAAINSGAPAILAEEAVRLNSLFIHYSTDYIFDGEKKSPYNEEDTPNPLNAYGKTKLAGEIAVRKSGAQHLIFRTSWVYGLRGKNFLLTILRLAREKEELQIVSDQVGTPNWCNTVAEVTVRVLKVYTGKMDRRLSGTYNLSSSGFTTWYEFARAILAADPLIEEQIYRRVSPIDTSQFPTPARRPLYSVLDNQKIQRVFGIQMGHWDSDLERLLSRRNRGNR